MKENICSHFQICSESTVLPKDDFDKFWDDCCRGRTISDASNVSSDEGIQSGGAASSGEESDEEVLWQVGTTDPCGNIRNSPIVTYTYMPSLPFWEGNLMLFANFATSFAFSSLKK